MARNFVGTAQVVTFASDAGTNQIGDITITAWIRCNAGSTFSGILTKEATTTTNMPYELRTSNAATPALIFIRAGAAFSSTQQMGPNISLNVWHHIAASWDVTGAATQVVKFYLDGALTTTLNPTNSTVFTTTTNLARIGNRETTLSSNIRLAHVCLYNKILNLNEILHDRAHGRVDGPNLMLYAPLYGAASVEADLSGNHRVSIGTSAAVIGGPPYVSIYGRVPFSTGAWAIAGATGSAFTQTMAETQGSSDSVSRFVNRNLPDSNGSVDTALRAIVRPLLETQGSADTVTRVGQAFTRTLAETQGQSDTVLRAIGWLGADTQGQIDTALRAVTRLLVESQNKDDTVTQSKDGGSTAYTQTMAETQSASDTANRFVGWQGGETQGTIDSVFRNLAILLTEGQNQSDSVIRSVTRQLSESKIVADIVNRAATHILSEIQSKSDFVTSFTSGTVTAEVIKLLSGEVTGAGVIENQSIEKAGGIFGAAITAGSDNESEAVI